MGSPGVVKKPRIAVPRGRASLVYPPGHLALSPELPESPPPPPFYFRPWLRLHTPTRHRNALWAAASVVRRSPDRKRLGDSPRPDASR